MYIHRFSAYVTSQVIDNFSFPFTSGQKRVLALPLCMLAFLAALYIAKRCCFQAQLSDDDNDEYLTDLFSKVVINKSTDHEQYERKVSDDGTIYECEVKNGKLSGKGKITFTNEIIYEGGVKDGNLNGKGKITYPNGRVFEGQFIDSILFGQGKIILPDGTTIEGEFKDGEIIGNRKIILYNGTIYDKETFI